MAMGLLPALARLRPPLFPALTATIPSRALQPTKFCSETAATDTFVFAGNFGKDTVADFHAASDVLQFSHTAFTNVADVLTHAAQVGADVTVTIDATHMVTLSNTVLSQLNAHNVHLV